MNVVTVMNYDWRDINYRALCYLWIQQAETWLDKNDICFIFSSKILPKFLLEKMKQSKGCKFLNAVRQGFDEKIIFPAGGEKIEAANFKYKFFIMCDLNFPFVFIDADAIIMSSLNLLNTINLNQKKPVICIDHEPDITGHTDVYPRFLNSGVVLVNDKNKDVLNWNKIYHYGKNKKFIFHFKENNKLIPGTDQAILKSYLDHINYDYTHDKLDYSYNTCAGGNNLKFFKNDESKWQVRKKDKLVSILHYWYNYKPWQQAECPMFQEILNDKMLSGIAFLD